MMVVFHLLFNGFGLNQLTACEHCAAIVGIARFLVGLQPVLFDHGTEKLIGGISLRAGCLQECDQPVAQFAKSAAS